MANGKTLVGVGVGPGDPQLLTLAAIQAIRDADVVFGPTTDTTQAGRAELIAKAILPEIAVVRILFDMTKGAVGVQLRRDATRHAAREVLSQLPEGSTAAFITLGDPNVFSTFNLLAEMVREMQPAISLRSIPGIMAFQSVVAQGGITLLNEEETLSLITGVEAPLVLERELADSSKAVVVYKGGRHMRYISEIAARFDRLEGAVVGTMTGMAGGSIEALGASDELPYLTTVVIPPKRS